MSCVCPGVSTLLSNLTITSNNTPRRKNEKWLNEYSK